MSLLQRSKLRAKLHLCQVGRDAGLKESIAINLGAKSLSMRLASIPREWFFCCSVVLYLYARTHLLSPPIMNCMGGVSCGTVPSPFTYSLGGMLKTMFFSLRSCPIIRTALF